MWIAKTVAADRSQNPAILIHVWFQRPATEAKALFLSKGAFHFSAALVIHFYQFLRHNALYLNSVGFT